ncbi:MAG: hypothetical protein ACYC2H_09070, partial [Thermoplasmatota archaeon]
GPPSGGFGGGAPRDGPRDSRGPPPRDDRPWKRKPQGAFRSDTAPARPPGSSSKPKDGKPKKDPTQEGF